MALTNRENSREFLTRGKFRLFFPLSPFFFKKPMETPLSTRFSSRSILVSTTPSIRTPLRSLPDAESAALFSPSPHARTFTPKESRSLRIHPEFTQLSPRCATVAKPVIRNWQKGRGKWRWDESAERHALAIGGIMTIVPILPVLFARSLIGHIGVGVGFKRKGARSDVEN